MQLRFSHTLLLAFVLAIGALRASAIAQETQRAPRPAAWTTFRGNSSTGATPVPVLPDSNASLAVEWTTGVAGEGFSTPVVAGDALYVTTAVRSEVTRKLFGSGFLVALLAAGAMFLGAARSCRASNRGAMPIFVCAIVLSALGTLTVFGFDLLGCGRDSTRRWIYTGAVLYLCQLAGSVLCQDTRRARWVLGSLGVGWSAWLLLQFPFWEIYTDTGIPLAVVLIVAFAPATTMLPALVGRIGLAMPLICLVVGFAYVLHLAATLEASPYLQRHPVHELVLPAWYWTGTLCLTLVSLVLLSLSGARGWRRRAGAAVSGLAAVMLLPGLASPVINASRFLKYQLVRGEFAPVLGWSVTCTTLAVAALVSWIASTAWTRVPRGRATGIVPLHVGAGLVLMCGVGVSVASVVPQTGFVCSNGAVVCLELETGATRWVSHGVELEGETGSAFNSRATPSPAVLGDTVFAYFGPSGLFACDARTGRLLWSRTVTDHASMYGAASSLAVSRAANVLIVQADSSRRSWAFGLEPRTGRTRWKTLRAAGETWRSPIVFSFQGRDIVCMWGRSEVDFLDANTGRRLHRLSRIDVGEGDPVSSPVVADGVLLLAGPDALIGVAFEDFLGGDACELDLATVDGGVAQGGCETVEPCLRIDLGGDGPVCATPAYRDGTMVLVSDHGQILGVDTRTRSIRWRVDSAETRSSPLIAGRLCYVVDVEGSLRVIRTDSRRRSVCPPRQLGEPVHASPIACGRRLFVRLRTKIVCLRGDPAH